MDIEEKTDWGDLPDKVIADAEESLKQLEAGMGISHEEVRKKYEKWLNAVD